MRIHMWIVLLFVLALCHLVKSGSVSFSDPVEFAPVHWGVDGTVSLDYKTHGIATLNGTLVSTDGAKSFHLCSLNDCVDAVTTNSIFYSNSSVHDFGDVTRKIPGSSWSGFESTFYNSFEKKPDGGLQISKNLNNISFSGIPDAVQCSKFVCPFRLQGAGGVQLPNGNHIQTAIVWWGGNTKSPDATSIMVFQRTSSSQGQEQWSYLSVLANASDYQFSQEGPNEHDLTVLPNGTVYAMIRMDGGDGPISHPYLNYYSSISNDGGKTWTQLQPVQGVGCARPRLLMLGNGAGPLLLSGGRQKNADKQEPMLWIDWDAQGTDFQPFSVSYYHNKGISSSSPYRFTSAVNTTSGRRESTCYTGLLATSPDSAMITYDVISSSGVNMGFGLPFAVAQ